MGEIIKPVRFGILLGLLGLVFGIGLAFWLMLGHEKIHEDLRIIRLNAIKKTRDSVQPFSPPDAVMRKGMENHQHMGPPTNTVRKMPPAFEDMHNDPLMELAHRMLQRSHIHAMGLGIVVIIISLLLAFTSAADKIKTIISVLTGIGGLVYPVAWIVMGYRTPLLGPEAAEESAQFIAGPAVVLILVGLFATIFLLVRNKTVKRK